MKLSDVQETIGKMAEKASAGSYIYRGESKLHEYVSSRLYRDHEQNLKEGDNIELIQRHELNEAKQFTNREDELEILAEIQHFGGSTNLIDFTTDYLIALFFACDGEYHEDGRLIFLDRNSNVSMYARRPRTPLHRVVAQKSVFVRPPKGRIDDEDYGTLVIPSQMKEGLLDHLRNAHGIFAASIYNDLHGFIRNQRIHREAARTFYEGLAHWHNGERDAAIASYTESIRHKLKVDAVYNNRAVAYIAAGDFSSAQVDLEQAISLNPRNVHALYNRSIIFMIKSSWEEAKISLFLARDLGMNVAERFSSEYTTVKAFEQKYSVTLPDDIVQLLDVQ